MNSKKAFYLMLGGVGLTFVLLLAGVVLGNMWLKKQSSRLEAVKLENRLLDEQQLSLIQAGKDITKYAELEKIARTVVPQDKDQARTVRELAKIAGDANVPIASISFPSSNLGSTTVAPKTNTSSDDTSSKASSAAPPVTQVKPAEGIPGVYQMEIIVQSDTTKPIPYSSLLAFLEKLEQNRRTSQVSSLSVQPSPDDSSLVTFILGVNVYIKP